MKALSLVHRKKWNRCFMCCINLKQHLNPRLYGTTHYDILGIQPDATPAEIKTAYLKLSKQLHPDLNPNDPKSHKKFVEIQSAYDVLSKPLDRNIYDMNIGFGHMHKERYRETDRADGEHHHRYYQDSRNNGQGPSWHEHAHGRWQSDDDFKTPTDSDIHSLLTITFLYIFAHVIVGAVVVVVLLTSEPSYTDVAPPESYFKNQPLTYNSEEMNADISLEAQETRLNNEKLSSRNSEDLERYE